MIFRSKTPPPAPLTNDAFARWLRARSPQPLAFFLSLDELEQETLAGLGDDYAEDLAIATAYAIRDPDAAAIGVGRDDDSDDAIEADLAARVGAAIIGAHGPAQATPARTAPTMGGVSQRRAQREHGDRVAKDEGRRLFGRAPDPVAEPVGSQGDIRGTS